MKKMNWFFSLVFLVLINGCASPYLKGVSQQGDKVYLGTIPIDATETYQTYLRSAHTDVDKQRYLFQRLRERDDLKFFHDGSWYSGLEAYRGGMWLMRHYYKKGQDARKFIRDYVERSMTNGQYHLVKFPDGAIHIGAYLLYNELDLLEETLKKDLAAGRS